MSSKWSRVVAGGDGCGVRARIGGCLPARGCRAPAPCCANVVLITIDTLRADRVGAYGYARGAHAGASTPRARRRPVRARLRDRADHADRRTRSLMTGRYPPGHGARHNGMRVDPTVPTLAERCQRAGFATGAFVARVPARPPLRADQGLSDLRRPHAARCATAAGERTARPRWRWTRRSPG